MKISIAIACDSQAPLQSTMSNALDEIVTAASKIYTNVIKLKVAIEQAIQQGLDALVISLQETYDTVMGIYTDLMSKLDGIVQLIAPFPMSVGESAYATITQLSTEWVARGKAIVTEYSSFLIQKMLGLIAALIPLNLLIPVPFFGTVDIVQFFADAEYRAGLKAQLVDKLDAALAVIPNLIASIYSGINGGLQSLEMRAQEVWQWFVQQLSSAGYELLMSAFAKLISTFDKIWKTLGLPDIIALLTLDVESLIQTAIDTALAAAEQRIQKAKDAYNKVKSLYDQGLALASDLEAAMGELAAVISNKWAAVKDAVLGIEVFGVTVESMVTLVEDVSATTLEDTLSTLISQAKDWVIKYPMQLLLGWLDKIKVFLKKIGLSALVALISMTLCDFLEIIGFPLSIEIEIPDIPQIPTSGELP